MTDKIEAAIDSWFISGRGCILGFVKGRPIATSRVVRASREDDGILVETKSKGHLYLLQEPLIPEDDVDHLLKEFGEASK